MTSAGGRGATRPPRTSPQLPKRSFQDLEEPSQRSPQRVTKTPPLSYKKTSESQKRQQLKGPKTNPLKPRWPSTNSMKVIMKTLKPVYPRIWFMTPAGGKGATRPPRTSPQLPQRSPQDLQEVSQRLPQRVTKTQPPKKKQKIKRQRGKNSKGPEQIL